MTITKRKKNLKEEPQESSTRQIERMLSFRISRGGPAVFVSLVYSKHRRQKGQFCKITWVLRFKQAAADHTAPRPNGGGCNVGHGKPPTCSRPRGPSAASRASSVHCTWVCGPTKVLTQAQLPPRRNDATGPQFTYPVPHSYQQLHGPLIQTALTCDKILFLPVPSWFYTYSSNFQVSAGFIWLSDVALTREFLSTTRKAQCPTSGQSGRITSYGSVIVSLLTCNGTSMCTCWTVYTAVSHTWPHFLVTAALTSGYCFTEEKNPDDGGEV